MSDAVTAARPVGQDRRRADDPAPSRSTALRIPGALPAPTNPDDGVEWRPWTSVSSSLRATARALAAVPDLRCAAAISARARHQGGCRWTGFSRSPLHCSYRWYLAGTVNPTSAAPRNPNGGMRSWVLDATQSRRRDCCCGRGYTAADGVRVRTPRCLNSAQRAGDPSQAGRISNPSTTTNPTQALLPTTDTRSGPQSPRASRRATGSKHIDHGRAVQLACANEP